MSATMLCEKPVEIQQTRLEQILTRAHEDVHARGAAKCPVCEGRLEPHGTEAACADCGSRLS
jgi:tRNA(Ile2) C34 agmatinyltransferase TiaS